MPKRILLIEDDRIVAKSLARLFEQLGFSVMIASAGDLALKLADANTFDLIISDIRMPGIIGTEVVRQILARPPHQKVPFIFITGYAVEEKIEGALEHGSVLCLKKPFEIPQLVSAIQSLIAV